MISLDLATDGAGIEVGDPVAVQLGWDGLDADVRSIRVSAQADVVLDGEPHEVADSRVTHEVRVSAASGAAEVELVLPSGSPATYVGRRFSIVWSLAAVVDVARARDHRRAGPSFTVAAEGTRERAALERAEPPVEK